MRNSPLNRIVVQLNAGEESRQRCRELVKHEKGGEKNKRSSAGVRCCEIECLNLRNRTFSSARPPRYILILQLHKIEPPISKIGNEILQQRISAWPSQLYHPFFFCFLFFNGEQPREAREKI